MHAMKLVGTIVLTVVLAAVLACGPSRTPDQAVADLQAPDAVVRMKAARDIEGSARAQQGLPPHITDKLLAAFPNETDPKTKGAIITALGFTGDPRVKPFLDAYLQTSDPDQQRWGARAYKKYVVKTGEVQADFDFPDYWPYGTPGFPAPVKD